MCKKFLAQICTYANGKHCFQSLLLSMLSQAVAYQHISGGRLLSGEWGSAWVSLREDPCTASRPSAWWGQGANSGSDGESVPFFGHGSKFRYASFDSIQKKHLLLLSYN